MEGDRAREPGSNGGRQVYRTREGRRREKWDVNFGHCAIFCNRKSTPRQEPLRKGAETWSTRYGKREIQTPPAPPRLLLFCFILERGILDRRYFLDSGIYHQIL